MVIILSYLIPTIPKSPRTHTEWTYGLRVSQVISQFTDIYPNIYGIPYILGYFIHVGYFKHWVSLKNLLPKERPCDEAHQGTAIQSDKRMSYWYLQNK